MLHASLLSLEFEHQALVITVSIDYETVLIDCKETASPQSCSFLIFRKVTFLLLKLRTLHGPNASLNEE